jgi:hypothetical protein
MHRTIQFLEAAIGIALAAAIVAIAGITVGRIVINMASAACWPLSIGGL